MADDKTVLVITQDDARWWAYSPELPGFTYGAANQTEFWKEVRQAVIWAGGSERLAVYKQLPYETPEGIEWLLRVPQDEHLDDRLEIAQRVHATVMHTDQRMQMFSEATPQRTGEYVFHCALFTDSVVSVLEAMRPQDETVIVSAAAGDNLFYAQELARGLPQPGTITLADLGLSLDSTIQDLMLADGAAGDEAYEVHLRRRVAVS